MIRVGDRVTWEDEAGNLHTGYVVVLVEGADIAGVEVARRGGMGAILPVPLVKLRRAGTKVEGVTITGRCGGCGG